MSNVCLLLISAAQLADHEEENQKSDQHRKKEERYANGDTDQDGDEHPLINETALGEFKDNDGLDGNGGAGTGQPAFLTEDRLITCELKRMIPVVP
jgi:hypothetical protein